MLVSNLLFKIQLYAEMNLNSILMAKVEEYKSCYVKRCFTIIIVHNNTTKPIQQNVCESLTTSPSFVVSKIGFLYGKVGP